MVAEAFGFAETLSRLGPDLFAEDRLAGPADASAASPRSPTGSARTCGSWPTSARSRSRSRPSRSARRRWPTSGTRCGPSGCARSPGSCMALPAAAGQTAATQWLERTLDDSAIRRLVLPQAFLAVDAVLTLYLNVVPGLVVHPRVIARHVADELPFMATENLLMAAVQVGGDRQDLHERIRTHSLAAAARLKQGDGDERPDRPSQRRPAFPRRFLAVLDPASLSAVPPSRSTPSSSGEVEPIRRRYPEPSEHPAARSRSKASTAPLTQGAGHRKAATSRGPCQLILCALASFDRGKTGGPEGVNAPAIRQRRCSAPTRRQTRAAWRALRRRLSSSRRRRSLGFS